MTSFSRRQLYSVLIAALFWALTVTGFVFIPIQSAVEEPVYKGIRIQLAPMEEKQPAPEPVKEPEPVVEEIVAEPVAVPAPIAEAPAPAAPAPAPKAAEPAPAPAAAKKADNPPSTPKALTQATPAPAEVATVPAPEPAKQTLVKSVDQLMAEQAASKGTKKSADEVDWDALFGESSTATSTVSTGEKTFVAQQGPSTSGQAAASTVDTGTSAAASSGRTKDSSVSSGTADALSSIGDAAGSVVSGGSERGSTGGVSGGTGTSGSGGSSSDGSGLEWGSGQGRRLINPSKPGISFTDEQKALITASVRDIRISFKVRADGTVLRESIIIDKIASLPAAISQAIERQISEWQFEKGTSDGQAVFLYSIIKE